LVIDDAASLGLPDADADDGRLNLFDEIPARASRSPAGPWYFPVPAWRKPWATGQVVSPCSVQPEPAAGKDQGEDCQPMNRVRTGMTVLE